MVEEMHCMLVCFFFFFSCKKCFKMSHLYTFKSAFLQILIYILNKVMSRVSDFIG